MPALVLTTVALVLSREAVAQPLPAAPSVRWTTPGVLPPMVDHAARLRTLRTLETVLPVVGSVLYAGLFGAGLGLVLAYLPEESPYETAGYVLIGLSAADLVATITLSLYVLERESSLQHSLQLARAVRERPRFGITPTPGGAALTTLVTF